MNHVTTFRENYTDIFIDPISQERIKNPVMNSNCGHTFEEDQIKGWMQKRVTDGQVPDCPLCRHPIGNLILNRLIKDAIDVLDDPENSLANRIEDLTDEEQERVKDAVDTIIDRRKRDLEQNIPVKLEEPKNFMRNMADSISGVYNC